MTREFGQRVHCPQCGFEHTVECGFSRWIRERGQDPLSPLASANGTVVTDLDFVVHRYCVRRGPVRDRTVQYMQLVEVKSNGAELRESQRDTLWQLEQIIRTTGHRQAKRRGGRFTRYETVHCVRSAHNKSVQLICYGVHTLQMSGSAPDNSVWMLWDRRDITCDQLAGVLSFELNPGSLRPMEHRSHKRRFLTQATFWPVRGDNP